MDGQTDGQKLSGCLHWSDPWPAMPVAKLLGNIRIRTQTDRQTGRQAGRQADRQTDRSA